MKKTVCLAICLHVLICPDAWANKYKVMNFGGSWNGSEGVKVTAGNDSFTVNFDTAGSAAMCAQHFVDGVTDPFTATRIGTQVTLCHPSFTPKLQKVHISDVEQLTLKGDAQLGSNVLLEVRGTAAGGLIGFAVEDLVVLVQTRPGQTAEEVVDALAQVLDSLTPQDDLSYTYDVEFMVDDFDGPPIDSVDLGIDSLGDRDLNTIQYVSNDPGLDISRP